MSLAASYAVWLVLLVCNEERVLGERLRRLNLLLEERDQAGRWEIIFVNDGSRDGTRQHIRLMSRRAVLAQAA
jgi:glycosyltransferase involved in cell wall biosynthesis